MVNPGLAAPASAAPVFTFDDVGVLVGVAGGCTLLETGAAAVVVVEVVVSSLSFFQNFHPASLFSER